MVQQLYQQPAPASKRLHTRSQRRWSRQYFHLCGWGLAAFSLLLNIGFYFQTAASGRENQCQTTVQSSAVLSRKQIAQLLTVPERSSRQQITNIVAEPYCQLPAIELRDGVTAEREAYPLAFSPSTWLVLLYEEDEYAGFSFSFQEERK